MNQQESYIDETVSQESDLNTDERSQSRSDSNLQLPPEKVKRACDDCRRRKVKCIAKDDSCVACAKFGIACTFHDLPKPRGRRRKYPLRNSSYEKTCFKIGNVNILNDTKPVTSPSGLEVVPLQSPLPLFLTQPSTPSSEKITDNALPNFRDIDKYSLQFRYNSSSSKFHPSFPN